MTAAPMDRAAAVRSALRTLVARNGFHGASMSAVASQAGVAAGTAYTHYASKDELVLAAYCEAKAQLGAAAADGLDAGAEPGTRFRSIWLAAYRHLKQNPDHARFLLQVDHSPYRSAAHQAATAASDPLAAQAARPDTAAQLLALPPEVIYELGLSPAVRLAAGQAELTGEQLNQIARACWRAITQPARACPLTCQPASPRQDRARSTATPTPRQVTARRSPKPEAQGTPIPATPTLHLMCRNNIQKPMSRAHPTL
jgi:AcrR family transcriptional regulator